MLLPNEVQAHIASLLRQGETENLAPFDNGCSDTIGKHFFTEEITVNAVGLCLLAYYKSIEAAIAILKNHEKVAEILHLPVEQVGPFAQTTMLFYDSLKDIIERLEAGTFEILFDVIPGGSKPGLTAFQ